MRNLWNNLNASQKLILALSAVVVAVCSAGGVNGFMLGLGLAALGAARVWPAGNRADARLICPHCHVQGQVTTWREHIKDGISGGKATAGILTGGLSLLLTGLSRQHRVTAALCANCQMRWTVR